MSYDVYYSTGGGSLVYGGSDVWVNNWLREVAPKLNHPSKLLIHRRKPDMDKRVKFDSPIEVIWQGDHPRDFEKIASEARKIHILHGYYTPHKIIEDNQDKIDSVCLHVCVQLSLKAGFDLGLPKLMHFSANRAWERRIAQIANKVVWIGLDKIPLHDTVDIIDIPNYYEFTQNKKVCMSNRVGYAARMETRKSPHFLEGVDSYAFTDLEDWKWWKTRAGYKFEKTRLYQFQYKNLHRFFNREDWGISHSCHLNEPFGYSIFQALDYGKLPILQKDWLINYEYPFRAFNKKEFDEQINNISELSERERQDYLDGLRDYCRKYDNKDEWIERYLEIYND
tara:strand:- start:115 stop:1128 length:1014 start_codon:yes stop_codon:yes gene_type:complete